MSGSASAMKRLRRFRGVAATGCLAVVSVLHGQERGLELANRRVLWLGDSVTQNGTYVAYVEYYLNQRFPEARFDIISIGLASETVSGLSEKVHPFPRPCVSERLGRALAKVRPELVVACYGMNDGIFHPPSDERRQAFQAGIQKLIASAQAAGAQVILLTPPPFDALPVRRSCRPAGAPDYSYRAPYENYNDVLSEYSRWELSLPATAARVIDLHGPLTRYIAARRTTNPDFSFTTDGIHPNPAGHLLMAHTILTGLGVPVTVPDLDAEVANLATNRLCRLIGQRRGLLATGWLNYVGYTRGTTVQSNSVAATEQAVIRLQQEIDRVKKR